MTFFDKMSKRNKVILTILIIPFLPIIIIIIMFIIFGRVLLDSTYMLLTGEFLFDD